ncbi:MAG: hypothetical protein EKK62_11000 [Acidimicrobiia bacterium]|nr:MAG: hypothetical protein EKK62_11000 [Acidimicrobiia bacterium]
MKTRTARLALVGLVAAFATVAAACAPDAPPPWEPPAPVNWSFKGTNITVNQSQDEVRDPIFGTCISLTGCTDEPYLLQVAFKVRIGQPGSADAWVVTGSTMPSLAPGDSLALSGGQQAKVDFTGVQPLDILSALNPANKMDVVGVYTWAVDEDAINSLTGGAGSVATIFKNALNATLAAGTLPNQDANALVGMIFDALFDNIGTPFNLILSNIPCLGLCDDVLGGAVYVGIGATGALAGIMDAALASATVPAIDIPLVDVPPNIQGGGFFTMGGTKNFTQAFTGAGGQHTYGFQSGPA